MKQSGRPWTRGTATRVGYEARPMTLTEWIMAATAAGVFLIAVILWAGFRALTGAEVFEESPVPTGPSEDERFVAWGRRYLEREGAVIVHDMAVEWNFFEPSKAAARIREHADLGDWEITDGRVHL